MAVATEPRYYPLDFLIQSVQTLARAGEVTQPEAVRRVLLQYPPDDEATSRLIYQGLLSLVHTRNGLDRDGVVAVAHESDRVGGPASRSGRSLQVIPSFRILRELTLAAADGKYKNILQFAAHDAEAYASAARAQAFGLNRRADAMDRVAALVRKHKVDVVGQLPKSVLAKVESEIAEAWR